MPKDNCAGCWEWREFCCCETCPHTGCDCGGEETVIAYEGRLTPDGRFIELGALYWGELPLPIFGGDPERRKRVGTIISLRRDEDLVWAKMDIKLPRGHCLSLDGDAAVIDYNVDEMERGDPLKATFKSMRIASGTLIPIAAWAWKDEDED